MKIGNNARQLTAFSSDCFKDIVPHLLYWENLTLRDFICNNLSVMENRKARASKIMIFDKVANPIRKNRVS